MGTAFLAVVVSAVTIAIGAYVTSELGDQMVTGYAHNVALNATQSLADAGTWLPLIAVVVAASIVMSLIVMFRSR